MKEYGIREHAVLAAFLVKAACEVLGEAEGKQILGRAIYNYGRGRGSRMAETAGKLGLQRDMTSFFLCGEWKGKEGENISESRLEDDASYSTVHTCAWYDTWKEEGLLAWGPLYCQYVDDGICDGFDGGFDLTIAKAKGRGDDICSFRWSAGADPQKLAELRNTYGTSLIRPFSFHCRDLLDAVRAQLEQECPQKKAEILDTARQAFAERFGEEYAEIFR